MKKNLRMKKIAVRKLFSLDPLVEFDYLKKKSNLFFVKIFNC